MMDEIVYPIAKELGFTLNKTGRWCAIETDSGYVNRRTAWDPIRKRWIAVRSQIFLPTQKKKYFELGKQSLENASRPPKA